jgi:hypothetical protein
MLPWVIKSRRKRWAGHATCMEDKIKNTWFLVGKPEGKNHLKDLGMDEIIILKWILKK